LLGVWSGAEVDINRSRKSLPAETGPDDPVAIASTRKIPVPDAFWKAIRTHWTTCQLPTGEWYYSPNFNTARTSMTLAGVAVAFCRAGYLDPSDFGDRVGRKPFSPHWDCNTILRLEAGKSSNGCESPSKRHRAPEFSASKQSQQDHPAPVSAGRDFWNGDINFAPDQTPSKPYCELELSRTENFLRGQSCRCMYTRRLFARRAGQAHVVFDNPAVFQTIIKEPAQSSGLPCCTWEIHRSSSSASSHRSRLS